MGGGANDREGPFRHRTEIRPPPELPPRHLEPDEAGSYIWVEDPSIEHVTLEGSGGIPVDPEVEEYQAIALHHPGFRSEVEELRKGDATPKEVARAAERWRLSFAALRAIIDAGGENIVLNVMDEHVFVEVRPAMYLLRVPRPLTRARREAISKWLSGERAWLSVQDVQADRTKTKNASRAPAQIEALDWFERWNGGESIRVITDSLPSGPQALAEENVRTRLQRVYREMKQLSSDGLRTPGP